jgi:AP-2 complex subunit alpha
MYIGDIRNCQTRD